jgi:hypothetical protein
MGEVHEATGVHIDALRVFDEEECVCECIEKTQAGVWTELVEERTDGGWRRFHVLGCMEVVLGQE